MACVRNILSTYIWKKVNVGALRNVNLSTETKKIKTGTIDFFPDLRYKQGIQSVLSISVCNLQQYFSHVLKKRNKGYKSKLY